MSNVSKIKAAAQSNRPVYDAASAINAEMTNATKVEGRQSVITMYCYDDAANYGSDALKRVFAMESSARVEWMDKRLSLISTEYVVALKRWTDRAEIEKKAKAKSANHGYRAALDAETANKKIRAARAMFLNALKACAAIRATNPLSVTLDKDGRIHVTAHETDDTGAVLMIEEKDDDGKIIGKTPVVDSVTFSGRELVKKGTDALGLVTQKRDPKLPTETPAEVARLNATVFANARKAVELANASKDALAKEIAEERDALLMTLIRSMFTANGRISDKAVHDWIIAHNKVKAKDGVSLPHVNGLKEQNAAPEAKKA